MKKITIAAAAALAVLSLTGCAQGAPEPSAQPSTPATAAVKPAVLTPAQEETLRGELRAIDAALDTPQVLPNTVMLCKTLSRGLPERAQREQAARIFFQTSGVMAPEGAADRIVEVIKANGFCQA